MKIPSILRCCLVAIAFVCLYSCGGDMEEPALPPSSAVRSIPVTLHATLTPFDASRQAPAARATALSWKEGDIIYLQYTADNGGPANGTLTYSGGKWELSADKALKRDAATKCKAYYFDGETTVTSSTVTLSPTTGVYADLDASYIYPTDDDLAITCHLKPQTSRIRFKGTKGTSFTLEGMSCSRSFTLSTVSFTQSTAGVAATIQSDGYSPYIYGTFADASAPQLVVKQGNDTFTADCKGLDMLTTGESGFMVLPTASKPGGWKMDGETNPGGNGSGNTGSNTNGHAYVDLGLPSGLKWATMNVGASKPEGYGDYFAWGETKSKGTYNWSTYKWCNGTFNSQTKYCTASNYGQVDNKTTLDPEDDAAHVNWGGDWRMPTMDELNELRNNCTWTWTTQSDVKGYKVVGSNGNSLFLPAAGNRYNDDLSGVGVGGYYWSSSLYGGDSDDAFYRGFNSSSSFNSGSISWSYTNRNFGQSVRPVCP